MVGGNAENLNGACLLVKASGLHLPNFQICCFEHDDNAPRVFLQQAGGVMDRPATAAKVVSRFAKL